MAWNRFGKFNAQKVRDDGYLFDSKREHKRYLELKILVASREIKQLEVHPVFSLVVNKCLVCKYEADFGYVENNEQIYEDVKGFENDVFKLKYKLFKALNPDINLKILTTK